jgi:hypothetical protein
MHLIIDILIHEKKFKEETVKCTTTVGVLSFFFSVIEQADRR